MRQDENMPILLKTQVESADKTPVTVCRARVGGLCGFRSAAERVPIQQQKTGCCADVRHKNSTEAQRSGFGRKRRCSEMDETCRLRRGEGYGACIDEAARQDKAAGACAPLGSHICPQCGQFRVFTGAFQKQRKTALGRCRMKKARSFKGNRGVSTKNTR